MISCFIGLGSNLDQPVQQIQRAVAELACLETSKLLCQSSLYKSKPQGPQDQPDYINAVVELETSLAPLTLLSHMQTIELEHKRVRERHWGPRTLDLDLLLYAQESIALEQLQVPHPEMAGRNFVLYPLFEIAPDLSIPGLGSLARLLARNDPAGLEKLDNDE